MQLDKKPRDFSYIHHKQNHPLELKGNMRRRQQKTNSNHHLYKQSQSMMMMNHHLTEKILENYQDLKSILPVDLNICKNKKESVRVYEQQADGGGSGAAYLMSKSQVERKQPEKRHLTDRVVYENKTSETFYKQKRHYCQNFSQSTNQLDFAHPKKHSQTLNIKLQKDLYSQFEQKQKGVIKSVKMSDKNMSKQGFVLGYEKLRQPKLSYAKKNEIKGCIENEKVQKTKNYRGDWRKSTFMLG